jgi:hypothetical protein
MTGDDKGAVRIYRGLMKRGVKSVGEDECGEGIEWAVSLLTDCVYRLATSLHYLGSNDLANKALDGYFKMCRLGVPSLYWRPDNVTNLIAEMPHPGPDEARKALTKLANSLSPVA